MDGWSFSLQATELPQSTPMLKYGGMYLLVHVVIILLLGFVPLPPPRRCAVSGEIYLSGKVQYSQVPSMHPRITSCTYIHTLHLHHYYYGAVPRPRLQFALTEVATIVYIPLHSAADLRFCTAPPDCTTLYCTCI